MSSLTLAPRPARAASIVAGALVLALSAATGLGAQDSTQHAARRELRLTGGKLVGTGALRGELKDAHLSAAQLSWLVRPRLALLGTFAWARSRDLATAGNPKLDVFTSDVGLEGRSREWSGRGRTSLTLFAGAGAGVRSYNHRSLDIAATTHLAGYGSVGAELGIARVGVRLEARDYATGFRSLGAAGRTGTRNDIVVMGTLRLKRDRDAQ